MPHLYSKVAENVACRLVTAAHIIAQGALCHLSMQFKHFLHFQILDVHKVSSFLDVLERVASIRLQK